MRKRADGITVLRPWDLVDHVARERLAGAVFQRQVDAMLALPHDAVTAEAGVLDRLLRLLSRMEFSGLARELGEEDRVASGQSHGRTAPRAVGRNIDQLSVRARLRHVILQAGADRAVAAEALIRRDELARGRDLA